MCGPRIVRATASTLSLERDGAQITRLWPSFVIDLLPCLRDGPIHICRFAFPASCKRLAKSSGYPSSHEAKPLGNAKCRAHQGTERERERGTMEPLIGLVCFNHPCKQLVAFRRSVFQGWNHPRLQALSKAANEDKACQSTRRPFGYDLGMGQESKLSQHRF